MPDSRPIYVGEASLRVNDLLNLRAWRGLPIFVVCSAVLGVYALSSREPYEGAYSHYFAGGIAVVSGLFFFAGVVLLGAQVVRIFRLKNPVLKVRIFADRVEYVEQRGDAADRILVEIFSEYRGHVEETRGLFLLVHGSDANLEKREADAPEYVEGR